MEEEKINRLIDELKLAQQSVKLAYVRQMKAFVSAEKAKKRLLDVDTIDRSRAIAAFALVNTEYQNAREIYYAGAAFTTKLEKEVVSLVTKNTVITDGKSEFNTLMEETKDRQENDNESSSDECSSNDDIEDEETSSRDLFHKGKVCHHCGVRGCCDCCKHPDH